MMKISMFFYMARESFYSFVNFIVYGKSKLDEIGRFIIKTFSHSDQFAIMCIAI